VVGSIDVASIVPRRGEDEIGVFICRVPRQSRRQGFRTGKRAFEIDRPIADRSLARSLARKVDVNHADVKVDRAGGN